MTSDLTDLHERLGALEADDALRTGMPGLLDEIADSLRKLEKRPPLPPRKRPQGPQGRRETPRGPQPTPRSFLVRNERVGTLGMLGSSTVADGDALIFDPKAADWRKVGKITDIKTVDLTRAIVLNAKIDPPKLVPSAYNPMDDVYTFKDPFVDTMTQFRAENRIAFSNPKSHAVITSNDISSYTMRYGEGPFPFEGGETKFSSEGTMTFKGKDDREVVINAFERNSFNVRVDFFETDEDEAITALVALPPGAKNQRTQTDWVPLVVEFAEKLLCLGDTEGEYRVLG